MAAYPEYQGRTDLQPAGIVRWPDGSGVASGLQSLGASIGGIARDQAEEANAQARFEGAQAGPSMVYRDDTGALKVKPLPAPDSAKNRAMIETAQSMYEVELRGSFANKAAVLREQFKNDPQGFAAAYNDFTQTELAGAPEQWLPRTKYLAESIGSQHLAGITVDVDRRQDALQQASWGEDRKATLADLISLSEAGLHGDPRYEQAAAHYQDLLTTAEKNRWVDPQMKALLQQEAAVQVGAAGVSAMVLADMKAQVAAGTSRTEALRNGFAQTEEILKRPEFTRLTTREREAVRDRVQERWSEFNAVSAADTKAIDEQAMTLTRAVNLGYRNVDPLDLLSLGKQYRALGAVDKANEIEGTAKIAGTVQSWAARPIAEQERILADLRAGRATPESINMGSVLEHSIARQKADANPEVVNIGQELASIVQGIDAGQPAPLDRIEAAAARLRDLGQGERAADLLRNVDAMRKAREVSAGPVGASAEMIAALRQQEPTQANVTLLKALEQATNEKIRALDNDAFSYGTTAHAAATGPVAPLNFSAIDTDQAPQFAEALKERARQARIISNMEGGIPVAPLSKPELETLGRVVATGNADQKAATAASLYDGLGEAGLAEVTPKLFKKTADQRAFAVAAEISAGGRHDVARAIFIGQDIMAGRGGEKVSVMPKPQDLVKAYQQQLYPVFDPFGVNDPTEAMQRGDMTAVMDRYQAMSDAATAYYAYRVRGVEAPDFNGAIEGSINTVTGGVLNGPQGYKVLAPRPGVTQSEFDGIWSTVTQDDVGPLAPAENGQRLTIQDVRDNGILRSVGDGEYAVYIDAPGGPRRLYRDPGNTVPVIINLRNKPAPERSWLPSGIGLFN